MMEFSSTLFLALCISVAHSFPDRSLTFATIRSSLSQSPGTSGTDPEKSAVSLGEDTKHSDNFQTQGIMDHHRMQYWEEIGYVTHYDYIDYIDHPVLYGYRISNLLHSHESSGEVLAEKIGIWNSKRENPADYVCTYPRDASTIRPECLRSNSSNSCLTEMTPKRNKILSNGDVMKELQKSCLGLESLGFPKQDCSFFDGCIPSCDSVVALGSVGNFVNPPFCIPGKVTTGNSSFITFIHERPLTPVCQNTPIIAPKCGRMQPLEKILVGFESKVQKSPAVYLSYLPEDSIRVTRSLCFWPFSGIINSCSSSKKKVDQLQKRYDALTTVVQKNSGQLVAEEKEIGQVEDMQRRIFGHVKESQKAIDLNTRGLKGVNELIGNTTKTQDHINHKIVDFILDTDETSAGVTSILMKVNVLKSARARNLNMPGGMKQGVAALAEILGETTATSFISDINFYGGNIKNHMAIVTEGRPVNPETCMYYKGDPLALCGNLTCVIGTKGLYMVRCPTREYVDDNIASTQTVDGNHYLVQRDKMSDGIQTGHFQHKNKTDILTHIKIGFTGFILVHSIKSVEVLDGVNYRLISWRYGEYIHGECDKVYRITEDNGKQYVMHTNTKVLNCTKKFTAPILTPYIDVLKRMMHGEGLELHRIISEGSDYTNNELNKLEKEIITTENIESLSEKDYANMTDREKIIHDMHEKNYRRAIKNNLDAQALKKGGWIDDEDITDSSFPISVGAIVWVACLTVVVAYLHHHGIRSTDYAAPAIAYTSYVGESEFQLRDTITIFTFIFGILLSLLLAYLKHKRTKKLSNEPYNRTRFRAVSTHQYTMRIHYGPEEDRRFTRRLVVVETFREPQDLSWTPYRCRSHIQTYGVALYIGNKLMCTTEMHSPEELEDAKIEIEYTYGQASKVDIIETLKPYLISYSTSSELDKLRTTRILSESLHTVKLDELTEDNEKYQKARAYLQFAKIPDVSSAAFESKKHTEFRTKTAKFINVSIKNIIPPFVLIWMVDNGICYTATALSFDTLIICVLSMWYVSAAVNLRAVFNVVSSSALLLILCFIYGYSEFVTQCQDTTVVSIICLFIAVFMLIALQISFLRSAGSKWSEKWTHTVQGKDQNIDRVEHVIDRRCSRGLVRNWLIILVLFINCVVMVIFSSRNGVYCYENRCYMLFDRTGTACVNDMASTSTSNQDILATSGTVKMNCTGHYKYEDAGGSYMDISTTSEMSGAVWDEMCKIIKCVCNMDE